MNRWTYKLDKHEMEVAYYVGRLRCLTAQDDDSTDDTGIHKSFEVRVMQNVNACIAEIAVSRMLNSSWTAMAWKQPDVGGFIEVRSITNPTHNLVVRAFDKDKSPMVLVLVNENLCIAKGWEFVYTIKEVGIYDDSKGLPYWRTKSGYKLREMNELLLRYLKRELNLHERYLND
jgi:hypothetical protein